MLANNECPLFSALYYNSSWPLGYSSKMSIGSPAYFIDDGSSLGSHMPSSSSEIEYLCPPSSLTVYSSSVSIFFSYKIISFNLADTKYLYKWNFLKAVNLQIQ